MSRSSRYPNLTRTSPIKPFSFFWTSSAWSSWARVMRLRFIKISPINTRSIISLLGRDTVNLRQCCLPFIHFINRIVKKQLHPLIFPGVTGDIVRGLAADEHVPHGIIHLQDLGHPQTAQISGMAALVASLALIKNSARLDLALDGGQGLGREFHRFFAMRAYAPAQTLGAHDDQTGS